MFAPVLSCQDVWHVPLKAFLQQTPDMDGTRSRFQLSAGIAVILDTARGDIVGEAGPGPEVAGPEHDGA